MSEVKITPLARRLAEENGIDWRQLQGTGPDGTVVERDILAFLAKVMAGEINLPPAPEEAPPPPGSLPDMAQAQAVLRREGVEMADLLPSASPPTPPSPTPALEDLEFDVDLENLPPIPPADAIFKEPVNGPPVVPNPSNLELPQDGPSLPSWKEAVAHPIPVPNGPEAQLPPTSPLVWEAEEAAPLPEEKPLPTAEPLPPTPIHTAPLGLLQDNQTAAPKVLRVQAWQRLVVLGPAQQAASALSEAWRVEVGLYPLFFRAVDKALADLQAPLRPTRGSLEGDTLVSLRVAPAQTLRGTLDSLQMASEPGEGLAVLSLLDTPFDQVVLLGVPTLILGRAQGEQALLSLSGEVGVGQPGELLERVAYYLERPILLA